MPSRLPFRGAALAPLPAAADSPSAVSPPLKRIQRADTRSTFNASNLLKINARLQPRAERRVASVRARLHSLFIRPFARPRACALPRPARKSRPRACLPGPKLFESVFRLAQANAVNLRLAATKAIRHLPAIRPGAHARGIAIQGAH